MGYTIKKEEIIKYPPEHLKKFEIWNFEYIDNLNFTIDPKECLDNYYNSPYSQDRIIKK